MSTRRPINQKNSISTTKKAPNPFAAATNQKLQTCVLQYQQRKRNSKSQEKASSVVGKRYHKS